MIVLSLIAILVSIATPIYRNTIMKAHESALLENLFVMRDSIDKYYADHGAYPDSLDLLVKEKYLRKIPVDPFTDSSETWVLIYDDDGRGIYDVHSGSNDRARDGTYYS
ncbi:MAG: type II secretion system protein G, partial [Desulfobacterales bacterium]|nr:type II secretion system protein G [Desulfobacterales bacterium]